MKIGICGGPELVVLAENAGMDYFEWSVNALLQPRNSLESFMETLTQVKQLPLSCPVVNVFVPGDLKITGPDVNEQALEEYIQTALERAEMAGVEIIVFGSGGARSVPDNFERSTAMRQLTKFSRRLAQLASSRGVKIALEPLNRLECNIFTSVSECADFVREINHPNFRLLVDAYHWAKEGESTEAIVEAGDLLIHAHIATPENRLAPGNEDFDFGPFFEALKMAEYTGRLSIEARLNSSRIETELKQAVVLIHHFA